MIKKDPRLIWVSVLAVVILALLIRGRLASRRATDMGDMPTELEQQILSFELSNYSDQGQRKWKLKGDSADILAEVVNLMSIDMETYDDPKIEVTALEGTYNKESKEISLFNDVEVFTSDGAMILTDYLKWDGKTDTITTDKPVRVIRSDVTATGIGALAMPQMKKVMLDKEINVKLTTNVIDDVDVMDADNPGSKKEKTVVTITCNGPLMIDYEKNIAVFEDDVLVDDKKGRIYSDKMEAFLDPKTKNIVKVVAEGGVRVVRGGDSTYSEKAIYTTLDRKIILLGRPKIYIQPTDEVDEAQRKFNEI